MQLPLIEPTSSWRPPSLDRLPSWEGAARISIDTETCDPTLTTLGPGVRRGGFIAGVSVAIEDGPAFYLPVRHLGGGNLPEDNVFRYLREEARKYRGEVAGANLNYDLDFLAEEGVEFAGVEFYRDVTIADPLIYELHMRYGLDVVAERLGEPGKDETLLREAAAAYKLDPKKELWKLPAHFVGAYAEQDARLPLRLLRKLERRIEEGDLWDIYNLESQVIPVLVKMRRRGVRVHTGRLEEVEQWAADEEREALESVHAATGHRIAFGDVWKAGAIAPALEHLGIRLNKTSAGQYNIDKDVLSSIDHPVARALARARKTNKLRTTFAKSVRNHLVRGRIHCTFRQIAAEDDAGEQKGARYGRLSCTDPNLQQQPSRDDFAARWRSIYLPEEGAEWGSFDYSQQEPRWTTHFAAVMGLPGAKAAARAYHDDPNIDNHQFMATLTGLPRKHAKNLYLGLCYGEGGAKLSRECGFSTRWVVSTGDYRNRKMEYFPTEPEARYRLAELGGAGKVWEAAGVEGQHVIDTFDARAPFIRKLAKRAEAVAKTRGNIRTMGGRRLHFPKRADGTHDWAHKALNRLIQGTSANQMKAALVQLDKAGLHLMLQVHDEADISVFDREREVPLAVGIMRDVYPAEVPFRVDAELGPSWGEAV